MMLTESTDTESSTDVKGEDAIVPLTLFIRATSNITPIIFTTQLSGVIDCFSTVFTTELNMSDNESELSSCQLGEVIPIFFSCCLVSKGSSSISVSAPDNRYCSL